MVSLLATSAKTTCNPASVSELPLAGISLAGPPEEPSSVQPALVVEKVPVPLSLCDVVSPLVKAPTATALTTDEVVVISTHPVPFLLYWNWASVLPAAVPPGSCSVIL